MTSAEHSDCVLDSFALLAYLQDEPGAEQVTRLLDSAETKRTFIWVSLVNLAEVLYIIERSRGLQATKNTIATIDQLPIEIVDVHRALAFSASHIKANHALSLADAFAIALAKEKNAHLVTGDPEFEAVAKEIPIDWLPRKK